jgi:hypothetical protein
LILYILAPIVAPICGVKIAEKQVVKPLRSGEYRCHKSQGRTVKLFEDIRRKTL